MVNRSGARLAEPFRIFGRLKGMWRSVLLGSLAGPFAAEDVSSVAVMPGAARLVEPSFGRV